jgi:hypothetical protein
VLGKKVFHLEMSIISWSNVQIQTNLGCKAYEHDAGAKVTLQTIMKQLPLMTACLRIIF